MENFKGTKGKWRHDSGTASIWHPDVIGHRLACVDYYGMEMSEEDLANAQLIAHAPELLDFINRISGEMLRNDFVLSEKWYDQAKDILTRATNI